MEIKKSYDVINSPFVELETPFTVWEALKMVVLLPTVPLRLLICVVAIISVAIVNSFAIYGCYASYWDSTCMIGQNDQEHKKYMLPIYHSMIGIFNHVSYLDAFVVVWAFCAAGVTFNFSKHLPILGYGVRALQNLYLPEGKDKSKQRASMVQLIKERAANRGLPMLSVAPEGTLSNGKCLLSFKTGAFVAGTPVVPFLLRYKLTPHSPAWTIIIPGWHMLRMMCQLWNSITVEVLPPYVPSEEEKNDPALYAANIRKLIADALGVPMVDQDRSHFLALCNAKVSVSWDGRRVLAPEGVIDKAGMMDLEPYMPGNYDGKKQQ